MFEETDSPLAQPEDAPAAPETEPQGQQPEQNTEPEAKKPPADEHDRIERRISGLTRRLAAAARERDEMAGRLAHYERQASGQQQQQLDPQMEQLVQQRAQELAQANRVKERVDGFHEAARSLAADWDERRQSLIAMGADAGFAELLVEMPDGARVAVALADDPEEVERIAAKRSERERAIELGKYAAKLAEAPARPRRGVSQAPRPITPVTGAVQPQFNQYRASAEDLADYYFKQDRERLQGKR